jgi:type IV secretion system protein VirB10
MTPSNDNSNDTPIPASPTPIRDQRTTPRGLLPRHLQTWLMVGLALTILAIILVTGRTSPAPRTGPTAGSPTPRALTPDRIQAYQRQLADDQARLQRELDAAAAASATAPAPATARGRASREPAPVVAGDPVTDEQRRREYQSLFTDNVAFTRRSGDIRAVPPSETTPGTAPGAPATPSPAPASLRTAIVEASTSGATSATAAASRPAATTATASPNAASATSAASIDGKDRLTEGTVIETVLINRLDGTFAGPVTCLVTTPVYSQDRQRVVIPAGARVLGSAAPVQSWGDTRLAVSFHRLVMPDGQIVTLDRFKGLDQIGDTGLKDQVNRHYLQVFGASIAIGALSGLAQFGTTAGYAPSDFENEYRQAAGASLAASAGRVLDRYLNVLPTITIREGYRIKIYLTADLELPRSAPGTDGGVQ